MTGDVPSRPLLVFDGQSLNGVPGPRASYPFKVLAQLDPRPERADVWINGRSWADLDTDAPTRLHPLAAEGRPAVLLMCGGQSDLIEGADGVELLDLELGYAAAARSGVPSHRGVHRRALDRLPERRR